MYRFLTANENASCVCQAHAPAIKTLPDSESSIKLFIQIMRIAAKLYRKNKTIYKFKAMPKEKIHNGIHQPKSRKITLKQKRHQKYTRCWNTKTKNC